MAIITKFVAVLTYVDKDGGEWKLRSQSFDTAEDAEAYASEVVGTEWLDSVAGTAEVIRVDVLA